MELPGEAGLALEIGSCVVEGGKVRRKPSEIRTTPGLEPDLGCIGASNLGEENGQGTVM